MFPSLARPLLRHFHFPCGVFARPNGHKGPYTWRLQNAKAGWARNCRDSPPRLNREPPISQEQALPAGKPHADAASAEVADAENRWRQFIGDQRRFIPIHCSFYRMGDFYELFFHGREVASRALGPSR